MGHNGLMDLTLEAILRGWAAGDEPERVRSAAAAYARYQNCGARAADRLFRTAPR